MRERRLRHASIIKAVFANPIGIGGNFMAQQEWYQFPRFFLELFRFAKAYFRS
jgi:hypothetical protein